MKFAAALPLLLAAGGANAYVCDYVPTEDVTDHSLSAVDSSKVTELVSLPDWAEAYSYYTSQTARANPDSTLQGYATKDWVASGAPDDILQNYNNILGENFLDSYNTDATQCSGTFDGRSDAFCGTAAKKNVLCTTLSYALYEVAKAGSDAGSEKNWDEGFAFWNGLYEAEVDDVAIGAYSSGAIQESRDGNFMSNNREASCDGFKAGQNGDMATKNAAIGDIAVGLVTTFSQAILKYSAEMIPAQAAGDTDKVDAKWAEGYTYYRCAAGLFDADFAAYVEGRFSPFKNDYPTGNEMYCELAAKMHETSDLGFGVSMNVLGSENFGATQNVSIDCGLAGVLGSGEMASAESGEMASTSAAPLYGYAAAASLAGLVVAYLI